MSVEATDKNIFIRGGKVGDRDRSSTCVGITLVDNLKSSRIDVSHLDVKTKLIRSGLLIVLVDDANCYSGNS